MDYIISSAESMSGDEVPVFAAIAIDKKIISIASNEVESSKKPWFHAEFLAIEKAYEFLKSKYLDNASLYVTLEPCAFCSAAIEKVRLKNIFFGAYDPKCGAIVHNIRLFEYSLVKPNIVGGIQETRCSKIITNFFKDLRKQ